MADLNEKLPEEAASSAAEKKTKEEKKPNFFARTWGKIKKFFRDYVSEMKKVVWLSRKETVRSSVVVVVMVVILSIAIALVDTGLEYGVIGLRNLGYFLR
ncbi:MAG: preprotein translocase subunit SecE [Clostridia bacterium]|nr:preprotein translocase subunit SecE [Clostridia bacterium]MBQ8908660.1 preprotein translocase subunit SecE [Clostridia bacterium]